MASPINPKIFRDYDIRGVYPDDINEDTYYTIGRSVCVFLHVSRIAVGFDMRLSSPSLFDSLTKGIMDQGVDVVNLGRISTEMHNFASGKFQFDANIIISASHNPAQYNGIKIVTSGAVPLHGQRGLPEIRDIATNGNFPRASKKGTMSDFAIEKEWIRHALSFVNKEKIRPLRVVIDAGNGMGGVSWNLLEKYLPIKIHKLYFEPDGRFPHHLPDPLNEKNLIDIQKSIRNTHADVGFAIDGDADRLFVLDENGTVLSGTTTTALLAKFFLLKKGPASVLYNAVCGKIVPETVEKSGGIPIRVRVGHSFIKEYMKKENALFAGEHSGHFYFRENYYADSSTIAGLAFLQFLSEGEKKLSSIVSETQIYFQSGEVNFRTTEATSILERLEKIFHDGKTDHLDGLSLWYPNWWVNMRVSKTEPYLRVNLEANTKDILRVQMNKIEELIKSFGGSKV
ncbi:phosphomannomutase/phosphoglucomutase [Candidatus Gottesmanbacteria bacterium]|nr:phosphomannomutase/phosphoglucomutase [Candidatus Gottesmanbacteria bacterium]